MASAGLFDRDGEVERFLSDLAVDPDPAAVQLDEFPGDGEPEARAVMRDACVDPGEFGGRSGRCSVAILIPLSPTRRRRTPELPLGAYGANLTRPPVAVKPIALPSRLPTGVRPSVRENGGMSDATSSDSDNRFS